MNRERVLLLLALATIAVFVIVVILDQRWSEYHTTVYDTTDPAAHVYIRTRTNDWGEEATSTVITLQDGRVFTGVVWLRMRSPPTPDPRAHYRPE